jgi:hypothetical protein
MQWSEEDLLVRIRSQTLEDQFEAGSPGRQSPAVRAYLLGYSAAALGQRPSEALCEELFNCPIEDHSMKVILGEKALAFMQNSLSGLLKKVSRGQLLAFEAILSWRKLRFEGEAFNLGLPSKKVVYGLVILLLKDIFMAISCPLEL